MTPSHLSLVGKPDPTPLPVRIAGPVGDNRGVEAAFLKILSERHPGARWEIADRSERAA